MITKCSLLVYILMKVFNEGLNFLAETPKNRCAPSPLPDNFIRLRCPNVEVEERTKSILSRVFRVDKSQKVKRNARITFCLFKIPGLVNYLG